MSLRLPAAALIAAIAFAGSLMASAPAAAAEPLATCFWEGPVSMKRPSSRGFDGPDRGRDMDGGTGLPAAQLVRTDGSTADGSAACGEVSDPDRSIPTQTPVGVRLSANRGYRLRWR